MAAPHHSRSMWRTKTVTRIGFAQQRKSARQTILYCFKSFKIHEHLWPKHSGKILFKLHALYDYRLWYHFRELEEKRSSFS